MKTLDKLLRKIEENYENKNKRELKEFAYKGHNYEVITLTRSEKFDLVFSNTGNLNTLKDIYEWFKPVIYKSFQLKELAVKSKNEGYINSYYEVIDMIFEPDDIRKVISYLFEINNLVNFKDEVIELQKKL